MVKLFLTIVSTLLLLLHLQPISDLATAATDTSFSNSQYSGQFMNLITKAVAAIIVLLFVTTISVYKPWGKIQTQNNHNQFTIMNDTKPKKSWTFYAFIGLVALILIFIISHLFGGGMHGH